MKKILAFILVLACVFAMASCGDEITLRDFEKAAAKTKESNVTTTIKFETAYGDLNARFETIYDEATETYTIVYLMEYFNVSDNSAEVVKSVDEGVLTCDKDGNYSNGAELTGANAFAKGASINFSEKKMNPRINGGTLKANIDAKNTKSVLGVKIDADVELTVNMSKGRISSYTMKYETELGEVEVLCSYSTPVDADSEG